MAAAEAVRRAREAEEVAKQRLADAERVSEEVAAEARAVAERSAEFGRHDEELQGREAALAAQLQTLEAREQQLQVGQRCCIRCPSAWRSPAVLFAVSAFAMQVGNDAEERSRRKSYSPLG
jgi:DNA repair exonuclease SbcCD ATPase subunit